MKKILIFPGKFMINTWDGEFSPSIYQLLPKADIISFVRFIRDKFPKHEIYIYGACDGKHRWIDESEIIKAAAEIAVATSTEICISKNMLDLCEVVYLPQSDTDCPEAGTIKELNGNVKFF